MKQLLKDIATIGAGQGAPQGDENYCNKGIPFVKAGNLQELLDGKDINNIQQVSKEVAQKHKLKLYPKGTILFAKSGMSCMKGFVYVLPQEAHVVSHLACITPNDDVSEYLRFYFNFHRPNRLVKDTAYPSISLSDIGNLEIDMKTEFERTTIIKQLRCIESVISLRQQELCQLDDLIKARFVEMFGDPVSNSKGLKEMTLPELGEFGRGVSKHRPRNAPELLGGRYPLIQTGEVANASLYICEYENTYSELGLKQSKMWPTGTLCITIAANIAKTSILTFDACFPDSVVGFKANERTNEVFVHYWFTFFQAILEAQAPESAQKNINLKILSELKVIAPEINEQREFESFVHHIDKLKVKVQQSLDETQILMDSLMQKYFG
ncbi:MAG: restriction endonuclease subunit S [Firmicutes bacterium]|nr:restriction endonuclease subunit S [Bacillota bacterium]